MIPVTVIFFAIVLHFVFLHHKNKRSSLGPLPPGPRPWPIIGCLPEMCMKRPTYTWLHELFKQFNTDIVCVRLGNVHVIAVQSPEIAREFLKKNDAAFVSRPATVTTHISTSGYSTAGLVPWGDQCKKMRKVLVGEVFSHFRLRWLLDKRNEEADNVVKFIYNQCSKSVNGSVVNVRSAVEHYSASMVRRMFFNKRSYGKGKEDGGPGIEEERHVTAILTTLKYIYAFCVSDYFPWLRVFDIGGHQKKVRENLKIIRQYQDPIIDERLQKRRSLERGKIVMKPFEEDDLLDVFISLKDANGEPLLSAEEIKAEITELQLAMVDNPFGVAEWTLSQMLNKQDMLKKAQEELDRVVGLDRLVQESDIPNLNYIKACARESLRLHPVAPFNLPRVSTADVVVSDYFIPKGSTVLLSRIGLGRNPKVWENPMTFDPERHLINIGASAVDLEERELRFISFSTGRRGCIGTALGTTMTVMLLARLLQGFTWSIPPNVEKIDLMTEAQSLFKLNHLHAHAKPRLPATSYPV